jgi:hypothetical protein
MPEWPEQELEEKIQGSLIKVRNGMPLIFKMFLKTNPLFPARQITIPEQ